MPVTVFSPREPDPIVPSGFDERLRPILDILPFPHRINSYGSVEIDVDHAGLEVMATLMSWTITLGYLEVREVIALGGYAPAPVSYTHRDVYKRQVPLLGSGVRCPAD